jgi:hypothetical protein
MGTSLAQWRKTLAVERQATPAAVTREAYRFVATLVLATILLVDLASSPLDPRSGGQRSEVLSLRRDLVRFEAGCPRAIALGHPAHVDRSRMWHGSSIIL